MALFQEEDQLFQDQQYTSLKAKLYFYRDSEIDGINGLKSSEKYSEPTFRLLSRRS